MGGGAGRAVMVGERGTEKPIFFHDTCLGFTKPHHRNLVGRRGYWSGEVVLGRGGMGEQRSQYSYTIGNLGSAKHHHEELIVCGGGVVCIRY